MILSNTQIFIPLTIFIHNFNKRVLRYFSVNKVLCKLIDYEEFQPSFPVEGKTEKLFKQF